MIRMARDDIKDLLWAYVQHRRRFEEKIDVNFQLLWRMRKVTTDAIEHMEKRM